MASPPKWYLRVAIIALIWNLLGCVAYLSDVLLKPDDVARLSDAQQALYAARTPWSVAATAIAVWCGAAGSLGLILRKRWANLLLIASLTGLIVQDLGLFVLTDAAAQASPVGFVIQGFVLLIAIALIIVARTAISRGWIPSNWLSRAKSHICGLTNRADGRKSKIRQKSRGELTTRFSD
jgi:hypothetical protein